jgi:hypothetical protein
MIQEEKDDSDMTEEDFPEAMHARQKCSHAFFVPTGKSFHSKALVFFVN